MEQSKTGRRTPKQARSRKRYQHILLTAANLFAEHGVDQVTTNHIAEAGNISVGSIYQFFPNKEAVIEGLIAHYLATIREIFPQEFNANKPIRSVVEQVLGGFMLFGEQNPGYRVMLIGLEGTSNQDAAAIIHDAIIDGIDGVLAAYYPQLSAENRRLCAQVSFGLVAGIMRLDLPPDVMLAEMIDCTLAYQQQFLEVKI